MSFLVELPRSDYPSNALNLFRVAPDFDLDNARATMWMSQLAYETADRDKVDDILAAWSLTEREFISNPLGTTLPLMTACAVVAGGRGATIVAFAGTDPLKINDWITDLKALPSANNAHAGFESAVDAIWPRIATAIGNRPPSEQALFFTGHSLGGALAIVAAQRALRDLQVTATAVYTFGSPRVGGQQFAGAYPAELGDRTYRLVHGTDLVATVPPSGLFRHVGCCMQCSSGSRFDSRTPILPRGNDKPGFVESGWTSVLAELRASLAGQLFRQVGSGWVGWLVAILPRQIRDHVPASYFAALAR